ncbi:MAG TPA: alpha/beta fold hydrolase [Anaeromyxobacteraceae bacterium]|nr:alpha/beta fold hydrolase [Anaeromyxobacteraceae bacterium]
MPAGKPVMTVLLPGLDGTARLFARFLGASDGSLEFLPIPYPPDEELGYAELESRVWPMLPRDRPFALLGESFSGPLALRIAARAPRGLVGLILATTFVRRPAAAPVAVLRPLAPAFFRLPLPRHVVRLLLAGGGAPKELVEEVRAAVALVRGHVMAARAHEALDVDATEALRRCPVPVLVLAGRYDRLLRRGIPRELKAVRPDAEVHLFDAPHLVLQCRPGETMLRVKEFVLRVARPERAGVA